MLRTACANTERPHPTCSIQVQGAAANGLLIHFDFDHAILNGIVMDEATEWDMRSCLESSGVCPGPCPPAARDDVCLRGGAR